MKVKGYYLASLLLATLLFLLGTGSVTFADENTQFMGYYRAWRDIEMKGVNTDLTDENWLTMTDIPYGIDIINVFSYIPKGQEEKAKPFFERLKYEYVPNLHSRGVKITKAIDYTELLKINYVGFEPTPSEYDEFANFLLNEHVRPYGIDGLDIDMEIEPTKGQIKIANGVIHALSSYIGPLANNNSVFVYDTNGSNIAAFIEVADAFTYLGYQQYGSDEQRTEKAVADYSGVLSKRKFMPGLTFPEERDVNRWHDTGEPYEESNIYKVAHYVKNQELFGMFLFALDRDGRTYDEVDINRIRASNFLWTKTAILEAKGYSLEEAKKIAIHHWMRVSNFGRNHQLIIDKIENSKTIFEVNKVLLGSSDNFENDGASILYDPIYERMLMGDYVKK